VYWVIHSSFGFHHEALPQSEQADQQTLEFSNQLYQSGLVDFLRVLDSERALYAAQDALVQSDQAISLNLVQLYKALGGWSSNLARNL
jgi:outer membrane protein TolC